MVHVSSIVCVSNVQSARTSQKLDCGTVAVYVSIEWWTPHAAVVSGCVRVLCACRSVGRYIACARAIVSARQSVYFISVLVGLEKALLSDLVEMLVCMAGIHIEFRRFFGHRGLCNCRRCASGCVTIVWHPFFGHSLSSLLLLCVRQSAVRYGKAHLNNG